MISDQTLIELDLQELTPGHGHGHGHGHEIVEFPIVKRIAGNQGIIADIKYVGPESIFSNGNKFSSIENC